MVLRKAQPFTFETNRDYQAVYFLKVDASGHSSIVSRNPMDVVERFFDAFENAVRAEVDEAKALNGCGYSQFWGWAGDGGLCVIYDEREESRALKTAIEAGCNILTRRLKPLRETLLKLRANGEFRIRLAVHKGVMRYTDFDRQGSIHSKDLNFVSHLEVATPPDCLAISKDTFDQFPAGTDSRFFELPFEFEHRKIVAFSERDASDAKLDWMTRISIADSHVVNVLSRRYSEADKAQIISTASSEIVDLGTALSTCSNYLVGGKRPALYREVVISLLQKQVPYICLILNPESEIAHFYATLRNESGLQDKIRDSVKSLTGFAKHFGNSSFQIWLYSSLPYFASICIDRKQRGLMIYAPYFPNFGPAGVARGDSAHMLIRQSGLQPLADNINSYIDYLVAEKTTERIV